MGKIYSLEERRIKYPIEYSLRDTQEEYKKLGELNKELESRFYTDLVKLAKAVIVYKYGTTSRLNYETLPHEIATALFITIVMRKKDVYSWTNLMKKVVRDRVSDYLRKEFYETLNFVDIDQLNEDNNELTEGTPGAKILDKSEVYNGIRAEDLIYFEELIKSSVIGLKNIYNSVQNLTQLLTLRLALYEVVNGEKHPWYKSLVNYKHVIKYNYYVSILMIELSPVLNHKYSSHFIQ